MPKQESRNAWDDQARKYQEILARRDLVPAQREEYELLAQKCKDKARARRFLGPSVSITEPRG